MRTWGPTELSEDSDEKHQERALALCRSSVWPTAIPLWARSAYAMSCGCRMARSSIRRIGELCTSNLHRLAYSQPIQIVCGGVAVGGASGRIQLYRPGGWAYPLLHIGPGGASWTTPFPS